MRSVKKRFKSMLAEVEQSAAELDVLSSQLPLLEVVGLFAGKVLALCAILRQRTAELDKTDFVERIAVEPALIELDELLDDDVMSALEDRLARAMGGGAEQGVLGELAEQLLEKLEKSHAVMLEKIQQLTALLAPAG